MKTKTFKEALAAAKELPSPESQLLFNFYSQFKGTQEELQASTEEMMAVLLSLQYVAFAGTYEAC
jgi:hypothetical protein